jgi:putative glutathione S-transferase
LAVPKKQKKIVSNESSEIIRMFYHEFDDLLESKYKDIDLLPKDLKDETEETNDWTYNGTVCHRTTLPAY